MLKIGAKVKLGENVYEVMNFNRRGGLSTCAMCSLFDNNCTEVMPQPCIKMIPLNAYLKKVEQSPQVDCK